jgi:nucleotide-binding universal stress UspA family protein
MAAAFAEAALRRAGLRAVGVAPAPPGASAPLLEEPVARVRREPAGSPAGQAAAHPDVPVRTEVAFGHPVRLPALASEGASVLFVGSRGHGGFAGMPLGPVSNGLIHHARCPLVMVPAAARDEPGAADT